MWTMSWWFLAMPLTFQLFSWFSGSLSKGSVWTALIHVDALGHQNIAQHIIRDQDLSRLLYTQVLSLWRFLLAT